MNESARWLSMGALGFEVAASVGAGAYAGYQLDVWLKCSPWFLLVGMIGGMMGAVWKTYAFVTLVSREDRRRAEKLGRADSEQTQV